MTVWNLTICRHSDGGKLTFVGRILLQARCFLCRGFPGRSGTNR